MESHEYARLVGHIHAIVDLQFDGVTDTTKVKVIRDLIHAFDDWGGSYNAEPILNQLVISNSIQGE